MSELENLIRSTQRWAATACLCLPDGELWTVETSANQVLDSKRPLMLVDLSGDVEAAFARTTWTQGDRQLRATMLVTAFPAMGTSARTARAGATLVHGLFRDAVDIGLVSGTPPVNVGGPFTVPLYEYAGVPLEGPGRAGPATPYAYLSVESSAVRALADPDDDRRWTVAMTLRLSWWAAGRDRKNPGVDPLVREVPLIEPVAPGDGPRA